MRVFVAGATGVIGRCLVPGLAAAGHGTPAHPSWRDGFPVRAEAFKSGKAA